VLPVRLRLPGVQLNQLLKDIRIHIERICENVERLEFLRKKVSANRYSTILHAYSVLFGGAVQLSFYEQTNWRCLKSNFEVHVCARRLYVSYAFFLLPK
jgi:hypothetical protein